jgi:hypothetical protein
VDFEFFRSVIFRGRKAFIQVGGGITPSKAAVLVKSRRQLADELTVAREEIRRQRRVIRRQRRATKQSDEQLTSLKKKWENLGGALPDFLIIGAAKSGTTTLYLYRLLGTNPYVHAAAHKEIHYFDRNFGMGLEWYRWHFRPRKRRGDRRTITGEASPSYLFDERVPQRVFKDLPAAKLIALLRNPVDRAYSHYQHAVRSRNMSLSFEQVIDKEMSGDRSRGYLARGIYVDQLKRWHQFFDRERLLVVESGDFFNNTQDTLKRVLGFLDLPEWEPDKVPVSNRGRHKQPMSRETRERLREYFEPHNQRLYDYLGLDFGW